MFDSVSIFSVPQFGYMDKFSGDFYFGEAMRSAPIAEREVLT
jgi:hypothetical protein